MSAVVVGHATLYRARGSHVFFAARGPHEVDITLQIFGRDLVGIEQRIRRHARPIDAQGFECEQTDVVRQHRNDGIRENLIDQRRIPGNTLLGGRKFCELLYALERKDDAAVVAEQLDDVQVVETVRKERVLI